MSKPEEVVVPPLKKVGRPPGPHSTPESRAYFRWRYYVRKAKKAALETAEHHPVSGGR